jgi:hypothetical protein
MIREANLVIQKIFSQKPFDQKTNCADNSNHIIIFLIIIFRQFGEICKRSNDNIDPSFDAFRKLCVFFSNSEVRDNDQSKSMQEGTF